MVNTIQKKSHLKLLMILLLLLAAIFAAVFYFGIARHQTKTLLAEDVKIDGVFLKTPQTMTDFHLTNNKGQPFTKLDLQGHWTMMFFGFTNCGNICPTTLAALNKMYKKLQHELPDNRLPQVVMVSVDGERDTVSRMDSYVNSFNPHFIGTIGEANEIDSLKKQLHIAAVKMQADGQGKDHYTINHSAEIILINPKAEVQAFMSYPHIAEQMAQDYQLILKTS